MEEQVITQKPSQKNKGGVYNRKGKQRKSPIQRQREKEKQRDIMGKGYRGSCNHPQGVSSFWEYP